MPKLIVWKQEDVQRELQKRLKAAREGRLEFEAQWARNERSLMNISNEMLDAQSLYGSFQSLDGVDSSSSHRCQ